MAKVAYVFLISLSIWSYASGAIACACCADVGDRFVEGVKLDTVEEDILNAIVFAKTAEISTGPRSLDEIEGIEIQSLPLLLTVSKEQKLWTFTFDDRLGNVGDLKFAMPENLTKFQVDPRALAGSKHIGEGTQLYIEWRLTARAEGDGMLSNSVGGDQRATLIIHGRGNHCPAVSDFNAWSLVLHGSKSQLTLFGGLNLES